MNKKTKEERYEILTYGMKHGVSCACRFFGVSRTIYYRWLRRFEVNGIDGLCDVERKPTSRGKLSNEIEREVLRQIKTHPEYGPQSIAWLLEEEGYIVSESGVYNIMRRTHLSTREQRLGFVASHKKEPAAKGDQPKLCTPTKAHAGDIWLCWTTNLGSLPGLGKIYQFAVMDAKSGFACARIYHNKNTECALDLLQGMALPVAESLNIFPKIILTPKAQEYTSGRSLGSHRYTATLRTLGIRQLLWSNSYANYSAIADRFSGMIHKLLYAEIFRENPDFATLYTSLQDYLRYYNFERRSNNGGKTAKTPYELMKPENAEAASVPLWVFINRLDI